MLTVTYDETKWKLVPMEPTVEMLQAAYRALECEGLVTTTWVRETTYRTMLAAAPDHPATAGDAEDAARLAKDHKGMRVDYSGLLKQACGALTRGGREPVLAEMLRQLQEHITELGQRWYAGDTAVVDELLQLYCVEKDAREALKAMRASKGGE